MRRTDDGVIRIVDDEPIRVIDDDDVEVPDGHTVRVRTSVMDDMMVVRRPAFDAADLADHQPGFRCDHERYLKAYRRVQNGYDDLRDRVSDAAVRDARSAWIAEMRDAWRGRQRDALSVYARRKKRPPDPDDDGDDDGDEYVAELPGTVPISPLGSEGQYNRTNSAPRRIGQSAMSFKVDARTAATAEYHRMCARLRDSWRLPVGDAAQPDTGSRPEEVARHVRGDPGGETDPDAAESIEERVERTRGRAWDDYKRRLVSAWKG